MTRRRFQFTCDDVMKLWRKGERGYELGREADGVPSLFLLKKDSGEVLAVEHPYSRGLIERIPTIQLVRTNPEHTFHDEHGNSWVTFEVDYLAMQTPGLCCECETEILDAGFMCLDGGAEACRDCVEILDNEGIGC